MLLLFLINAVFRGAGDAAIAMRVLWIANAINIVLDPCFIFGLGPFPRLGVTGAAVATTTGRGIGVLVQLYVMARGDGRIVIRRAHLRLESGRDAEHAARLSGSAVLPDADRDDELASAWCASSPSFGSVAVAACTIVIRIIMFVLLPSWGLSNAAATLVGQNLGAGQPDRAETSVWRACLYNMAFLSARRRRLCFVFADAIVGVFTTDPAGRADRHARLRIISAGFLFYAARLRADAVVQRRRRHADADAHQPRLLLGVRDSAGLRAGASARHSARPACSGRSPSPSR